MSPIESFINWVSSTTQHVINGVGSTTSAMGPLHWTILAVAVVVLGCLCLRGFGSRSQF